MKNAGLLEEEDGEIKLSLLGKVCSESSLSFESILRFIQLLRQANTRQQFLTPPDGSNPGFART